jgi:hypothetical protein
MGAAEDELRRLRAEGVQVLGPGNVPMKISDLLDEEDDDEDDEDDDPDFWPSEEELDAMGHGPPEWLRDGWAEAAGEAEAKEQET